MPDPGGGGRRQPMVYAHPGTVLGPGGYRGVDDAQDGAAAVESVLRHQPHVVLLGLRMPGVDGLSALEQIRRLPEPPSVVVLTTFDADECVLRAWRAGAVGSPVKSTLPANLVGLVRVVVDGRAVLSPGAARRLVAASGGETEARERTVRLVGELSERGGKCWPCWEGAVQRADRRPVVPLRDDGGGSCPRMLVELECPNRTQAESGLQRGLVSQGARSGWIRR